MSGTIAGGKVAAATNYRKYGKDFYRDIGSKGGKLGRTGGFWADRELARTAGKKGGTISRRGKKPTSFEIEGYTIEKRSFLKRIGDRIGLR